MEPKNKSFKGTSYCLRANSKKDIRKRTAGEIPRLDNQFQAILFLAMGIIPPIRVMMAPIRVIQNPYWM